jgi:myo-inositol catabolism protein IolC
MKPQVPLYLLPFDHRHSYLSGLFQWSAPLSEGQRRAVTESKQMIYEGFREALETDAPIGSPGIMIDEEFGAAILRDAVDRGYVTALATERSGSDEFAFEYGAEFAAHIEAFQPTFAKALVRFNPEGDPAINRRQASRLRQLSDYCAMTGRGFMLELLVPPSPEQRAWTRTTGASYDRELRPRLVLNAIRALQEAGVEPDLWKVEGLSRRVEYERVVAMARRDGRREVGCIVLGRGAEVSRVVEWVETAGSVPGFIGFAVGRTTFWDAIADYLAQRVTRAHAVSRIAWRYRQWVEAFETARPASLGVA